MDPLTHSLAGLAVARSHGGAPLSGRAAALIALVAANAPDVEALLWLYDPGTYARYASTATHSLIALALAPLLLGWPLAKLAKAPLKPVASLVFWVVLSHLALDAFTPRGVQLGYPFAGAWVALPWLYWVEPWLWVALGATWWLAPLWRAASARRRAAGALAAAVVGIAASGAVTEVARARGWDLAEAEGLPVEEVAVFPAPLWPTQRSVFLIDRSATHHLWFDLLGPPAAPLERWAHNRSDPAVAFLRQTRPGRVFARWAVAPAARVGEVIKGGGEVTVALADLRWRLPGGALLGPQLVATITFEAGRHTLKEWRWLAPGDDAELPGLTTPAREPPPRTGPPPRRGDPPDGR
jgi:inner membrane protein